MKVTAPRLAPIWLPLRNQGPRNFYPCHVATASFEHALETFGAKSTRFKARIGRPRGGRHFMLALPSGRFALVTSYDDARTVIDITLELEERSDGNDVAYLSDLMAILQPLGVATPDKSRIGFPIWR